ncbi:hypothetical protein DL98DRAFT_644012, partial [Cadophora sp. DSE1049]
HQMKAIDFIRQRENGDLPVSLSLWKEKKLAGEKAYFQHVLTGAKRPQRDEAQSGIIADDMGLGKTLVVLSAIAGSFSKGKAFVLNHMGQVSTSPGVQHALRATRATLILAPSTLLIDSWINEISTHTYPGRITFHKHLGPERHKPEEMKLLFEKDIVFTTFATVASELMRRDSPLAKIHWFRIVLDEAHEIRNRLTKQFEAVHGLTAQHRWCLTGTPIQNSLEDLGALISFLRVPILEKVTTFRRYIIQPTSSNLGNRYRNLQTLLQSRNEYDELYRRFGNLVQMAVSGQTSKVSATALHSIHELRLFCNNGLRTTGGEGVETDDELLSDLLQREMNTCANCSGPIFSIEGGNSFGGTFISTCKHLLVADGNSIVFSSWKKTLDLAGQLLKSYNMRHDFIHGGLNLSRRLKILGDFKSPTGPNILLMTLGTGAVGLNLAVASHIYILEPQWNPFIEFQAMARAQRIGQTQQVVVIRYIMENTIEQVSSFRDLLLLSNVLRKQRKKAALAGDGFGKQKLSESLVRKPMLPDFKANDDQQEYFGIQTTRRG